MKKFEPEWEEFERRRGYTLPTRTDLIKGILKGLGYIIGPFLLVVFLDQFFGLFPKSIETTVAIEIIKAIIQVNGVLIGFSGLVFAQLLWAIHSQQNIVYEQQLGERYVAFKSMTAESPTTVRVPIGLDKRLKELEATKRNLIVGILQAILPLIISILYCLIKMA